MSEVTIHQAKTNLSKLLVKVQSGREVIVRKGTKPIAKLVPYHKQTHLRPRVGEITSAPVKYSSDCFAPMSAEELEAWGMA